MPQTASMTPLDREIVEVGARLERLRSELRDTPMCSRSSKGFLDKSAERLKLLARLEALRRLSSLS